MMLPPTIPPSRFDDRYENGAAFSHIPAHHIYRKSPEPTMNGRIWRRKYKYTIKGPCCRRRHRRRLQSTLKLNITKPKMTPLNAVCRGAPSVSDISMSYPPPFRSQFTHIILLLPVTISCCHTLAHFLCIPEHRALI